MIFNRKLILTDADGVLLDWEKGFEIWMGEQGYVKIPDFDVTAYGLSVHYGMTKDKIKKLIREFNSSAAIGYLQPFRDATRYVPALYAEGWDFVVITSLSKDRYSIQARIDNLSRIFPGVYFGKENVICLDTGADKDEALAPYRDSGLYWIEDKDANAQLGHDLGLKTIMLSHGHNETAKVNFPIVKNWEEIYEIIEGD